MTNGALDFADGCTESTSVQVGTLFAVVVPFAGLIVAIIGCWGWGFTWIDLSCLLAMYVVTGLGITVGFHRLFTHRAFETVLPIKVVLAVLGSMAMQGPLLFWVATHRRHHQHSDKAEDPHSPHSFGHGILGILAGWWHAHIGWMFKPNAPRLHRYLRDFRNEGALRRVSKLFGLWVLLGMALPATVGGLISGTWVGAFLGFLWGGLVRIFLLHHVTWSINSICHLWGTRPYSTHDQSRNNALWGVIAFGEGWHNNHHAFPASARHGLRWWQIDTGYYVIRLMKLLGLAWRVRLPRRTETQGLPAAT